MADIGEENGDNVNDGDDDDVDDDGENDDDIEGCNKEQHMWISCGGCLARTPFRSADSSTNLFNWSVNSISYYLIQFNTIPFWEGKHWKMRKQPAMFS